MALEQKLHLRLAQKLVMTPTLQQAIKLLQLSRLELEQELTQEVQANPLLEMVEESPAEEEAAAQPAEGGKDEEAAAGDDLPGGAVTVETGSGDEPELARESDPFSQIEIEALFSNYLHDTARVPSTWEDEEETPLENSPAPEASMFEALCQQVHLASVEPQLAFVCEFIIGNLDPDGYLRTPEHELASQLGVPVQRVAEALGIVQGLDPAGIGARSLQECLVLQLARHPDAGQGIAVHLAARLVAEAWDDLLHQRWDRISDRLRTDRDRLRDALDVIRALDPRPGARLGPNANSFLEPDVIVTKAHGTWKVTLNDEGMPRLRLSPHYQRLLASRRGDSATSSYLRERMRAALWFLRSVEQRQSTVMRVSEAIVSRQSEFLDRGLPHLRPLVLRDIADDIGMHESTVSRVVSNKYMATPRGVVPLKFFFHSAISHAVDGDISSVVVKERIKALIGAEDPQHPLSDARVARQLNRLGIRIARRTVAKYREELGIPSSEQRRRALR